MLQDRSKRQAYPLGNRACVNNTLKYQEAISRRAYVLIDSVEGKVHEGLMTLRGKPGITFVDYVEGPPDIIMMAEAEDNQTLANLTIKALISIENLTNDTQILPVCSDVSNVRRNRAQRVTS